MEQLEAVEKSYTMALQVDPSIRRSKLFKQRNYRFFILFISSSTFLCIFVFTFSLVNLLRRKGTFMNSMSDDVVSVILVCYCFVVVWFVGGFTIFHFYLMSTNQTTYESFRYQYDKTKNPHKLGLIHNLKQIFFTKIPPPAVNFREMVLVEEAMPETPSYHMGFGKNFDMQVGHTLPKMVVWWFPACYKTWTIQVLTGN